MSRFSPGNPNVLLSDLEANYYDNVVSVLGNGANTVVASDTPAQARAKDIARHKAILTKTGGLGHLGAGSRLALIELNSF
jgi:hypothetical protein